MKKLIFFAIFLIAGMISFSACKNEVKETSSKPRIVVTTDGEVDDQNSFIRLMLYSNEFNIEGLIYSSSQWHYSGDGKGTLFKTPTLPDRYEERTDLRWPGTEWMQNCIDKYAMVYDNLKKHKKDYPSPDQLRSVVKTGNIEFEGEMEKDTEGSDWIKSILLDDKPGPVYLQIWGGTNTVARALKSIQDTYENTDQWDAIYKKVSDKAIIYAVLDQDITYNAYVKPNWPEIRVIYNSAQFWSFAYMWPMVVPDELKVYMDGKWNKENIVFNHGPLLDGYFTWGDGKQIDNDPEHFMGDPEQLEKYQRQQYDFIAEGDSPAFFYLLNVGLRNTEDPSYGGLGGRFVLSDTNKRRWEDGEDVVDYDPYTGKYESAYPQIRWVKVIQNDFAARANWCVKDYAEANHTPIVKSNNNLDIKAKPGREVKLSGMATDPDGNNVSYKWWQYVEAGTCSDKVILKESENNATCIVPEEAKPGDTIHIILEVTDDGTPVLTRFQRYIITVS